MPLFPCRRCLCVENTALANFWYGVQVEKKPALCSECDPEIGKWHKQFERRTAIGYLVDANGMLWLQEELDRGVPYKIVGAILQPRDPPPYEVHR